LVSLAPHPRCEPIRERRRAWRPERERRGAGPGSWGGGHGKDGEEERIGRGEETWEAKLPAVSLDVGIVDTILFPHHFD
jgi:hypothetical protein